MKRLFLIFIFISLHTIWAQEKFLVEDVLKETTFHYSKDKDGDLIVKYRTKNGRDQSVIVSNKINGFQGIYLREVMSVAKIFTNETLPPRLPEVLLIDNYTEKYMGNWGFDQKDDITTILFIVKLPYNVGKDLLEAAIIESAEAADALEQALGDLE